MKIFGDEKERRRLDLSSDSKPSMNHHRNYLFFKRYIKNKKVLDVGCWTGQFEELIAKDAKEIVAIDPGSKAIEYARKKIPKVKFMIGTLDSITLPKNSFEVIFLLDVLEHLPRNTEEATFKKIHSLLRKGGYFMITTPNSHPISIMLDPAFFLIGHRHYSEDKLGFYLKESGFEIVDFSIRGGFIQALFNNISLLAKHVLGKKIKETSFIRKNIEKGYRPGGFLTNCIVAKKLDQSRNPAIKNFSPRRPS